MRIRAALVGLALLCVAGPGAAAELTVFAAASLTDVLHDAARAYEAHAPDHLTFSFGSSTDLARQIRAGAPADVFFSADAAKMDDLERDHLVVHDERHDLLSNVLVVIVPKDSSPAPRAADGLLALHHIALGDPETVPAGVYARTWLQSRGLWDRLHEHVVPTVDVRAALAAVADEHADAGIVYRTDAAVEPRVRIAFEVPAAEAPAIVYGVAPLSASSHAAQARTFVRWLAGPEARAIYQRRGFLILAEP